ncbi:CDK5 regulatory subunit-associated protein 1-like 1 [Fukomys damarensis]|uniref:CDK5 regulatory subunit-associated protein 1-like 1 n=1 Tax=Fukomys damarensis TaxID=885580 RepID=A0A091EEN1_FUKDA|nr:CDK5 regulatory subunit-associated protein 1-like 1 [Fukomys damarensis]
MESNMESVISNVQGKKWFRPMAVAMEGTQQFGPSQPDCLLKADCFDRHLPPPKHKYVNTPPELHDKVPGHSCQDSESLSKVLRAELRGKLQIGEKQKVLVTEESFDSKFYVAHNRFYEQVLVPKNPSFMGKMVEVDIYESGKHFMKGLPVSDAKVHTPSISKPLAKGEVSGLTKGQEQMALEFEVPVAIVSVVKKWNEHR